MEFGLFRYVDEAWHNLFYNVTSPICKREDCYIKTVSVRITRAREIAQVFHIFIISLAIVECGSKVSQPFLCVFELE